MDWKCDAVGQNNRRSKVNGRKKSAMCVDLVVSVLFDPCWSTRGQFVERKKRLAGGEILNCKAKSFRAPSLFFNLWAEEM